MNEDYLHFWECEHEATSKLSRHVTIAHSVSWILSTTSTAAALLITVIYWALLFSPDEPVAYLNVFVHGLNSVIVVVDVFISAREGHHKSFLDAGYSERPIGDFFRSADYDNLQIR